MMKRQILWMMATILICGTTTVTLSSCSEDDNATPTGGIEIEPMTDEAKEKEPTTDQMAVSVTASVPAAEWLNEVEKPRVAQAPKRAATRANAEDAINELMDPSETFTFVGNAGFRDSENETCTTTSTRESEKS